MPWERATVLVTSVSHCQVEEAAGGEEWERAPEAKRNWPHKDKVSSSLQEELQSLVFWLCWSAGETCICLANT